MAIKCLKHLCELFLLVEYAMKAVQNIWKLSIGLNQYFGFKEFKLNHSETKTRVNFTGTPPHLFRMDETQKANSIHEEPITGFYHLNPNPPEKK